MNKSFNISIVLSAVILSVSMIACSYMCIFYQDSKVETMNLTNLNDVMILGEVAEYLKMSEEDVLKIIKMEQEDLSNTGSFSGRMFPYFKVGNNYYIYKEQLKKWLNDVTSERRVYDTSNNNIWH